MDHGGCLEATGALAAARALEHAVALALEARQSGGASTASLESRIVRLQLRDTWTTTTSSSEYRDTVHVRFARDGAFGLGEGAPIVRFHEDAAGTRAAVEAARAVVLAGDPWQIGTLLAGSFRAVGECYAARAALDMALHDWIGKKLGLPLHRLLGLDARAAPITSFSIGIDTPEVTRRKVREAAAFPVLKVKVGRDGDEATIEAVRSVTDKPLRVYANEGWPDRETAIRKIEWLAARGVELVEQPMPAALLDDAAWLRARTPLPLFADEACLRATDIPKLNGCCHGVNLKLDKAGGLREALHMIHTARSCGLQVMLGCMVSSSVSTTAAAQLSPLVDLADLDGHLLVANDPYEGVGVRDGRLILPSGPGLGLREPGPRAWQP